MNQTAADTYLAAAVVVHDARVLIVRRSYRERFLPGAWGVPCGKLDRGELAETGALRELKEETGILGTIVAHTGSSGFLSDYQGRRVHNHQDNFIVRPLTLDVVLPSEDQAYAWARPAELAGIGVDAYNLGVIRQALGGRLDAAGIRALTARFGRLAPPPFSSPKSLPESRVRQGRRPVTAESWAAYPPARRRRP
ncbi:NUDIX domain-containing protein [Streptomyces sp. NPDC048516]|uniref:NUDIX domain-containing protein n=1 Tax=Streptomyces sp. NPDC048516 TaxID=3365565 RepID=UPI00371BFC6A